MGTLLGGVVWLMIAAGISMTLAGAAVLVYFLVRKKTAAEPPQRDA